MEELAGVVNQLTAFSFAGYLHQAMEFVVQCNGSLFLYYFDMQKEENQKTNKFKYKHSRFQVDCPQSLFL